MADTKPYFIAALDSGDYWGQLGQGQTLTYSFVSSSNEVNRLQLYSSTQQQAVRDALTKYSNVADIKFIETTDSNNVELRFFRDDLTSKYPDGSPAGYAYYPTSGGDVHIHTRESNLSIGSTGFTYLLHEIGHALGLKHPGQYSVDDAAPFLPKSEDSDKNTVMSYTNTYTEKDIAVFDKAAIHYQYGVNPNAKVGNDTYSFSSPYIWDGGGTDTISAVNQTQPVSIDLNPGSWIYMGAKNSSILATGQAFIGYGTNIENAIGGNGNDSIKGNVLNNTLHGGSGNDVLYGDNGDDSLNGGIGNDTLTGGLGRDSIDAGSGDDSLDGGIGDDILNGGIGTGNDTLNGGDGIDTASYLNVTAAVSVDLRITDSQNTRGAGSDKLTSIENVSGTGYNDTLLGNSINNVLDGRGGNDSLNGMEGNDTLMGGVGHDSMDGGSGDDSLDGGSGNDILNGGYGDNVLDGGDGIDTASYLNRVTPVNVNLEITESQGTGINDFAFSGELGAHEALIYYMSGIPTPTSRQDILMLPSRQDILMNTNPQNHDTLISIENVSGTAYNDTLLGNSINNVLDGREGNDSLNGMEGNDTLLGGVGNDSMDGGVGDDSLNGGTGNDVLNGGLGNDILNGNSGIDTASYLNMSGVTIDLNITRAQATGGAGTDTLIGIENLYGSNNNDTLTGNAGANELNGRAGNDILIGGSGRDSLTGGTGSDTFKFLLVGDSSLSSTSRDIITDFRTVEGDKIDLSAIDANRGTTVVNDSFVKLLVGSITPSSLVASSLFFNLTTQVLYGNVDSVLSAADFSIQLTGVTSLAMSDIIV